jgi:hypothetical protein
MSIRTLFISIISLIIITVVGGAAFLWYQAKSTQGFEITLTAPEEVSVGVPFELIIEAHNDSESILENAELSIELPEELVFVGQETGDVIKFKNLGSLGIGSITEERIEVVALSGENNIRQIITSISYSPGTVGSRFKKTVEHTFPIIGSSIGFDIEVPTKVFTGEAFTVRITYQNKGVIDLENVSLTFAYPSAFTIRSSSFESTSNNVWNLGSVKAGSEDEVIITGELVGPDNAFFEFDAIVQAVFGGRLYPIAEKSAAVTISPSPLALTISVNNDPTFIASPGNDLQYRINFINSTDVGLRDVIVTAQLIGEMFDLTSISTNGVLRSHDNTLIWNAANTSGLSIVNPGASGQIEFTIRTKKEYPIKRLSDRNFMLKVAAAIESPTVPFFVEGNKTVSVAELETKVNGQVIIDAQGFFRDAASGILNKGNIPLRVGNATQFTIHWVLTNYSNDIEQVEVRAFLGGNVRFTGITKSNGETEPVYNERTQEVIWTIPVIPAAKGLLNKPLEAIFQVEAIPSVTQVGNSMSLIRETTVTATDSFTKVRLSHVDGQITTVTLDDLTVSSNQGEVQP